MKKIEYYFVSEDEWPNVCNDGRYWTDFSELDEKAWDDFTKKCDQVDQKIKGIFKENDEVHVIDSVTYFSHRGIECSPQNL
ncbi:MAG TPA: hypothetical protein DCX06_11275, partial [Opitutae bacterium]|nr:hypothetical protein [Opitutae bacterium]